MGTMLNTEPIVMNFHYFIRVSIKYFSKKKYINYTKSTNTQSDLIVIGYDRSINSPSPHKMSSRVEVLRS